MPWDGEGVDPGQIDCLIGNLRLQAAGLQTGGSPSPLVPVGQRSAAPPEGGLRPQEVGPQFGELRPQSLVSFSAFMCKLLGAWELEKPSRLMPACAHVGSPALRPAVGDGQLPPGLPPPGCGVFPAD